jgi:hypothetical protein
MTALRNEEPLHKLFKITLSSLLYRKKIPASVNYQAISGNLNAQTRTIGRMEGFLP